ncbi:MAG: phospholipase D-like domain-containing protein [Alphaproteobacteria bacterium]|nr:phospholipase D-like domain-containing protein [Alphaproteobacteria bacterium]
MELINNLDAINHQKAIASYAENADHIIIVSPFIFDDFSEWFKNTNLSSLRKVELVTSLAESGDNQIKKPFALKSFFDCCEQYATNAEVCIHANNKLHGKIYLFRKSDMWLAGIITSANFTWSGLEKNHEWGILTREPRFLDTLYKQVFSSFEYENIPKRLITTKLIPAAEQFKKNNTDVMDIPPARVGLLNLLERNYPKANETIDLDLEHAKNIFLKPNGDKDNPVSLEDRRPFGPNNKALHFPKNPAPSDVMPGDVVISFGTGSRALLCIHTVLTRAEEASLELQRRDKNAARWPWYVSGRNHTPYFGDRWWEYNITVDNIRDEFLKEYPGKSITGNSNSLGAFNYGAGKLSITLDFARYIVEKIMKIEAEGKAPPSSNS